MGYAVAVLLAGAVLCTWLAALGLLRLPTALDRVHGVSFVNATSGGLLLLAALATEGATIRVGKIALAVAIALVGGGVTSHAVGRMIVLRRAATSGRTASR